MSLSAFVVESLMAESTGLLPLLDDDAVLSILCSLPGSPPTQARALNQLGRTSHRLHELSKIAAKILVEEHMRRAHAELNALRDAYSTQLASVSDALRAVLPATLDLDLDGPVAAASETSPLLALSSSLPKLPLQWTALRNSITNWHLDGAADRLLPPAQCIEAAGLSPVTIKGAISFTWEVEHTASRSLSPLAAPTLGRGGGEEWGDDDESELSLRSSMCSLCDEGEDNDEDDKNSSMNPYAKPILLHHIPLDIPATSRTAPLQQQFAGFLLASRLGIATHPGLLARHKPTKYITALCPCCRRHRRPTQDGHANWNSVDTLDKQTCLMPTEIMEKEAYNMRSARSPHSTAVITHSPKGTRRAVMRMQAHYSARDCEVLDEMDFSDMLEQIELHQSIKCTCDGGGDAFRFIGAPPGWGRARKGGSSKGVSRRNTPDDGLACLDLL